MTIKVKDPKPLMPIPTSGGVTVDESAVPLIQKHTWLPCLICVCDGWHVVDVRSWVRGVHPTKGTTYSYKDVGIEYTFVTRIGGQLMYLPYFLGSVSHKTHWLRWIDKVALNTQLTNLQFTTRGNTP